jgi:hypothetical protein
MRTAVHDGTAYKRSAFLFQLPFHIMSSLSNSSIKWYILFHAIGLEVDFLAQSLAVCNMSSTNSCVHLEMR